MDVTYFLGILALGTLLAVLAFAMVSKRATEKLLEDDRPTSALAKDGKSQK